MLENWFSDPGKVGATALLMGAVWAFAVGRVVPRWMFDLVRADCEKYKDLSDRLLQQIERSSQVSQSAAEVAAKAIERK